VKNIKRKGLVIFLFTTSSRLALRPTQSPMQWVPGTLSLGLKRPGREANNSILSSAEVKNAWGYTSIPQYALMAWCSVKKQRTGTTLPLLFYPIGVLEFHSRRRLGIPVFSTASGTALGSTQPPIQWVPGALSLGVKRPGREADHSPPSNAEVKECWSNTSTSPIRLHGAVLS
jgi:hypothetical protein